MFQEINIFFHRQISLPSISSLSRHFELRSIFPPYSWPNRAVTVKDKKQQELVFSEFAVCDQNILHNAAQFDLKVCFAISVPPVKRFASFPYFNVRGGILTRFNGNDELFIRVFIPDLRQNSTAVSLPTKAIVHRQKHEKQEFKNKQQFIEEQEQVQDNDVEFDQEVFDYIQKNKIDIENLDENIEEEKKEEEKEGEYDEYDLEDLSEDDYIDMMNEDIEENKRLQIDLELP